MSNFWSYSIRTYWHDSMGEWITVIREADTGYRQEVRMGELLTVAIHHEDGFTFVPLENREEIIKSWEKVAASWGKRGPGNAQWDTIDPVYGSIAWETSCFI